MNSLWDTLPKPIFSLAPMEDVTDTVFRQMLCTTGKPDVFFTEFTNVDGIASQGRDVVARRLLFTQNEHPLIAQIWGMVPENYYKTAQELVAMGFDGIDINMGCPQHDVTRHGACSALIKNHQLAKEIIQATKEGAVSGHPEREYRVGGSQEISRQARNDKWLKDDDKSEIPVSVKTRIGFSKIATEDWIGFLLEQNVDLITIHGRTAAEMSKVPAHWDEIGKAVALRDEWEKKNSPSCHPGVATTTIGPKKESIASSEKQNSLQNDNVHKTLIFGNGDVGSLKEAQEKVAKYHVDGVMIGRGVFHNPWLFAGVDPTTKTVTEKLKLLEQHVRLFEATWGNVKSFQLLKKYFKIYLSDFDGASDMRQQFMETNTYDEAKNLVRKLLMLS